ncbi:CE1759 family FMN reductase [uncultured Tessaracoccus sp.]|uniref:CE1759 family FMN reductase n=1 Tax=uncultured Tessaracoccus sp. TaxID=905023 RepID=UPI0025E6F5C0|nr:CE1759 family FMN reductase [uncultured Tessaracoccus sp.]
MRIVTLSGGLRSPSSSRTLADELTAATLRALEQSGEEAEAEVVELRDHAHAIVDTMLTGFPTGEFADVVERVTDADALIVVTPTFSAGMAGLVKSFFDVIEQDSLRGMPVLLAATGGTERHSLVIDHALRPLFAYFGAEPIPTGVYAATSDFGGEGTARLGQRIERAAQQLVERVRGTTRRDRGEEFVEFEQLLRSR